MKIIEGWSIRKWIEQKAEVRKKDRVKNGKKSKFLFFFIFGPLNHKQFLGIDHISFTVLPLGFIIIFWLSQLKSIQRNEFQKKNI